ncbi:MAG TPA: sugar transferase [Actinomycetota bacterium]|nr:sugar transferase [Actinomycetota bacterium]
MSRRAEPTKEHRPGKDLRERGAAGVALIALSPVFAVCIVAIRAEAMFRQEARGPVFFREKRMARGRVIELLKFRTLTASALASLGPGPTHIARLEEQGMLTGTGRVLKKWYLDELPQLWNIVRGDMGLIGTRPYPIELYEAELARGITRKRDMPTGLIGPVQAHKGATDGRSDVDLDLEYWEEYRTASGSRLLRIDLGIVARSLKVQLEHRGL